MKNLVLILIKQKLLVFSFLVTGFTVISSSELQAQTFTSHNGSLQTNFVNAYVAIDRLEAELASLKVLLASLNPNSQIYRDMNAKYEFYDRIRAILVDGRTFDSGTVAITVEQVSRLLSTDTFGLLSKTYILQLKQSIHQLLQQ